MRLQTTVLGAGILGPRPARSEVCRRSGFDERPAKGQARASSPSETALAAMPGCTGACACRRAGSGARCRRVEAVVVEPRRSAGSGTPCSPPSTAGHHHLRRLPAPLSIGSAHGWLGAVGFSASALRLRRAIRGWGGATSSTAHLHRVVCLPLPHPSRGAVPPSGQRWGGCCAGWRRTEARYRYRPWLVETSSRPRTRERAGGELVCVGPTAGRGRCDRAHDGPAR